MKTLGVGIIGAGFMGKTHTYNYVNLPLFYGELPFKIKLVGICNRTLSKAQKLKEDFGFEFATSNYTDLLERSDIDIIDVCTPNNVHHRQIVDSLNAGKHVYADKPLCITDEEAADIVDHAGSAGVVHQVGFHNRFYPAAQKIKMLLDEGFLGKPISFRASYYHSSNLNPKKSRGWRQDISRSGGGVLYDMGSHVLDLVYYYLGEYEKMSMQSCILYPERPDEKGEMVKVEADDHALVNARMKNSAFGTIETSKIIAGSNDDLDLELYGTEGAVKFSLMNPNFVYVYDTRDKTGPVGGNRGYKAIETLNKDERSPSKFPGPRFGIGWLRGHIASQYNFVRCVYEGQRASPSLEEAAYIQRVMNLLYRVNNTGEWGSI
ncbi:MAG: Gfo/Idh/MocA family protein [Spirochaetota bacterium]